MRAEKAAKYKEFKQSNDKKKFEEWFLNYRPDDIKTKKEEKASNKINKKITKKGKKTIKKNKTSFFNIYGSKSRKNKKG